MTLDEQLKRLEDDVRRLKIEYDVFFNGGSKRAPQETKGRVEATIKRLGEERNLKFGQRYYYNTIVARYVSLRELWRRTLQEREEGVHPGRVKTAVAESTTEENVNAGFSPVQIAVATGQEAEQTKQLYDSMAQAKQQCGEINNIPFDQFQRMIEKRTVEIKDKMNCLAVAYEVAIEDGMVKFKARPVR